MTITPEQQQAIDEFKAKVIADYEAKKKEELRQRMSKLGRVRSAKKRAAARKTIVMARAAKKDPRKRKKA